MARRWIEGTIPVSPGVYFRTTSGDVAIKGAINGIVAVVYKGNWGALNTVVDIAPEDMNNLKDIVGTGAGYNAVYQAFRGGALRVLAVRVGSVVTRKEDGKDVEYGNLSKAGLMTVATTIGTGESAVTKQVKAVRLYAKYPGKRSFTVTLKKSLTTNRMQLMFYEGTRLMEVVEYDSGGKEPARLVKAVNENSKYFTAKLLDAGKGLTVKMAEVAQQNFKVGTDPLTSADAFSKGLDVLERYRWNVVVTTSNEASVHALLTAYVQQCYDNGQLIMTVIGGTRKHKDSSGATVAYPYTDRVAYATATNDWRVVYVPSGWLGTDGLEYEGYQSAAYLAGMIAGSESNTSITHLVIQGALRPLEDLSIGEAETAMAGGCVVLQPNDEGQVWVGNANNTLVTLGNNQDEGWKKIRRTKTRFEFMARVNRTCDELISRLDNDAHGRATIVTVITKVIRDMITERKLFTGSYVEVDTTHQPVGDRAYFIAHIGDIDSLEKIFITYNFSYANPFSELDVVTTA